MEKQTAFLNSNNPQLGNLDIGQIYIKPKNSILSFFKSNIFQLIIIFIALITIIILSFQVNSQCRKLTAIKEDIAKAKKTYSQLDYSIKKNSNELVKSNETKGNMEKIVAQDRNNLLDSSKELEMVNAEQKKLSIAIKEYQKEYESETISYLRNENNKLLIDLSRLIIDENGAKNEKLRNRISEILTNYDIQLLEQWTGKKLMFACFNSNIYSMSGRQFHKQCDMFSETILLLELKNTIIGGYTSQDWRGNQDKFDDKAFIFNLRNKKKFNVRPNQIAICPNESDLPVFSKDISLTKDIYYSQFPHSYGTYDDKEAFGIDGTMIEPRLVEVIVVN